MKSLEQCMVNGVYSVNIFSSSIKLVIIAQAYIMHRASGRMHLNSNIVYFWEGRLKVRVEKSLIFQSPYAVLSAEFF